MQTLMVGYIDLNDKPSHFFNGESFCINIVFCNKLDIVSEYEIYHYFFRTRYNILAKVITKIFVYSRS